MKCRLLTGLVLLAALSGFATNTYGAEIRSYITKSRMIIESGSAYPITPALYTELEIGDTTLTKRTYTIRKEGIFMISEIPFNILMRSKENISDTRPRWVRKLLKSFGKYRPVEAEEILRAINTGEMSRGIGRSYVMLTVGQSFLTEVDSQCPYPTLTYPNITEYRYYGSTPRRPTSGAIKANPSDY